MRDDTPMDDPSQVPQPLGPRIRVARENAGLNVTEAARRLGVAKATLQAWEDDRETPRANRLLMLAGLLNVSLSWFLEGRESEHMTTQGDVAPIRCVRNSKRSDGVSTACSTVSLTWSSAWEARTATSKGRRTASTVPCPDRAVSSGIETHGDQLVITDISCDKLKILT